MDTVSAARRWAETWERAWPAGDAEAVATLYSTRALFYSHPFRAHQSPEDYAKWAFSEQAGVECRFGEPIVAGDRAAVDWWAIVSARDGSVETLAGISLLRFDADGLVIEQRDAWAAEPGRQDLPSWAPR